MPLFSDLPLFSMPKQTLFLTSPVDVNIKNGLLQLVSPDESSRPVLRCLEDLKTIIIDNHSVHITIPTLNLLSQNHISVVFCDERHIPVSMLADLDSSSIQGKMYRAQIEAGVVIKKKLWKQIVERKIQNQSALLGKIGAGHDLLKSYYMNVKSGDSTNREAQAAKVYWRKLFGKQFVRDRIGDPPNNLLNYAYAILRAYTARALMGSGLLPSLGIFHRNYFNSFPLADDIMEPYRPFIDEKVFALYSEGYTDIDKHVKYELANIFYERLSFDLLSQTTSSLASCFCGDGQLIYYPKLI